MCDQIYFTCGGLLTDENGGALSYEQCRAGCEDGSPSQAQAACVAGANCAEVPGCLQPVPASTCDAVCTKVYETCANGALEMDGILVDEASCRTLCPAGLSNRQATCILGADCTQWVHCAP